jgi:hypothetical protein
VVGLGGGATELIKGCGTSPKGLKFDLEIKSV